MFEHEYQGGTSLLVWTAQEKQQKQHVSSQLSSSWSSLTPTYDRTCRGYIYHLHGQSHTKWIIPPIPHKSLSLFQPFLILQLYVSSQSPISLEFTLRDTTQCKRRLILSSSFHTITITALHAQLPLSWIKRDVWLHLVMDMSRFVDECWSTSFRAIENITVGGECRIRRVFTVKQPPADTSEDEKWGWINPYTHTEAVPRQHDYAVGVTSVTQLCCLSKIQAWEHLQRREEKEPPSPTTVKTKGRRPSITSAPPVTTTSTTITSARRATTGRYRANKPAPITLPAAVSSPTSSTSLPSSATITSTSAATRLPRTRSRPQMTSGPTSPSATTTLPSVTDGVMSTGSLIHTNSGFTSPGSSAPTSGDDATPTTSLPSSTRTSRRPSLQNIHQPTRRNMLPPDATDAPTGLQRNQSDPIQGIPGRRRRSIHSAELTSTSTSTSTPTDETRISINMDHRRSMNNSHRYGLVLPPATSTSTTTSTVTAPSTSTSTSTAHLTPLPSTYQPSSRHTSRDTSRHNSDDEDDTRRPIRTQTDTRHTRPRRQYVQQLPPREPLLPTQQVYDENEHDLDESHITSQPKSQPSSNATSQPVSPPETIPSKLIPRQLPPTLAVNRKQHATRGPSSRTLPSSLPAPRSAPLSGILRPALAAIQSRLPPDEDEEQLIRSHTMPIRQPHQRLDALPQQIQYETTQLQPRVPLTVADRVTAAAQKQADEAAAQAAATAAEEVAEAMRLHQSYQQQQDEEDEVEQSTNMRPVSRSVLRRHHDDVDDEHDDQHDDDDDDDDGDRLNPWRIHSHTRPQSRSRSRATSQTHDVRREQIPTIDDMRSDDEAEDDQQHIDAVPPSVYPDTSPFEPRPYHPNASPHQQYREALQHHHHQQPYDQHQYSAPLRRSHSPPSANSMHAASELSHSPSHSHSHTSSHSISTRPYSPSISTRPYSPSVTMRPPMSHMPIDYITQQPQSYAQQSPDEDDDASLLNEALGVYAQEKRFEPSPVSRHVSPQSHQQQAHADVHRTPSPHHIHAHPHPYSHPTPSSYQHQQPSHQHDHHQHQQRPQVHDPYQPSNYHDTPYTFASPPTAIDPLLDHSIPPLSFSKSPKSATSELAARIASHLALNAPAKPDTPPMGTQRIAQHNGISPTPIPVPRLIERRMTNTASARRPFTPPVVPPVVRDKPLPSSRTRATQENQQPHVSSPIGTDKTPTPTVRVQTRTSVSPLQDLTQYPVSPSPDSSAPPSLPTSPSASFPSDGTFDLMYDPILRCYYAPATNSYYELTTN